MSVKLKATTALFSFLSFFLFAPTSSVDLPTALKKSEIQENQDGREFVSRMFRENNDGYNLGNLEEASGDALSISYSQSDIEEIRESCNLDDELLQRFKSSTDHEWIINATTLELLGNDPQTLIQCTEAGDRVVFTLSGVHQFNRTMVVSHELELVSEPTPDSIESDKDDFTSVALFTCPDSDPFLIVNSSHFEANGFVIRNCEASSNAKLVVISSDTKALFNNVRISNNKRMAFFVSSNADLTLKDSYFESNGLKDEVGGVILSRSRVNLTIHNCYLHNNKAKKRGGAIASINSNITIKCSRLNGNTAGINGGVIDTKEDVIEILNSYFTENIAKLNGGALMATSSIINITHSFMKGNKAASGGVLYVDENSEATIKSSILSGNNATQGGAMFSNRNARLEIYQSDFMENNATLGGCLHGDRSDLHVRNCNFTRNIVTHYGGCIYLDTCTANLQSNSFITNQATESGGGIYATRRATLHLEQTHFKGNSADNGNGGGVALVEDSTLFCSSCNFVHNKAIRGGGLYIKSNGENYLVAQLTGSSFRNNMASSYGGGMVVKTFGIKSFDCKDIRLHCDRIVLFAVSFEKNTAASFGSIITSASPDNVLVNCDANYSSTAGLMSRNALGSLMGYALETIHPEKMCDSWKDKWLLNNEQKVAIGTFGYKLNITTNSTNGTQIVRAGDGDFKLDVDRSAKFPAIIIDALDAFGNSPAPLLFDKDALLLSSPNRYFRESSISFELNLSCIISYTFEEVSLLYYTIRINPREEDIPKPIALEIYSKVCGTNEELSTDKISCKKCSDWSYSFERFTNKSCKRCPNGADCNGMYIVPKQGYWHKFPCQDKVKKCIMDKACKYYNRSESLEEITQKFSKCGVSLPLMKEYNDAQCLLGYKGVLCGSCEKHYGSTSNFECIKCKHVLLSVFRLVAIACYLLFGTVLTIKGILPLASLRHTQSEARIPLTGIDLISTARGTNSGLIREVLEDQRDAFASPELDYQSSFLQENDLEKRKGKILEAWKILLNFFQVTSNAAIMDIKWTNAMLTFLQKLQIFGVASLNRLSSPLDCIFSSASHATRAIWRVLFSLLLPSVVVAILMTYWAYRTIVIHERDGLYFLRRFLLTLITVTYITYFDLTQIAVRVLNCVVVYDNIDFFSLTTTAVWVTDTSIECYQSPHLVLAIIAVVILILVSVGFPLFCSFVLVAKRNVVHTPRSWAHDTLGFLCGPFKERFIYWECITMTKKVLLSIIIIFPYFLGSQGQGLLTLLVLVFFLYIHFIVFPYNEEYHILNYYESGSLLVSCITYTLVQFLNVETCSELSRGIVSASVIALNSCFVCIMLYKILKDLFSQLRAILESRGILVLENMNIFSFLKFYYQNRRSVSSTS